ncbi:MAG: hypothetical protein U0V56_12775 [Actinomycetota bacterium]
MTVGCAGSGAEPTPTVAPDCDDLSAEPTYTIELVDYAFHPSCAIVTTEAPFELRNTGEAVHTFTLDGTAVDIEVGPGDDFASEDGLDVRPGVYLLRCTLHEQMFGTLEVR